MQYGCANLAHIKLKYFSRDHGEILGVGDFRIAALPNTHTMGIHVRFSDWSWWDYWICPTS